MLGRAPHKRMLDRDTKEDFQLVDTCLQQVGMQDFSERLFSSVRRRTAESTVGSRSGAADALFDFR